MRILFGCYASSGKMWIFGMAQQHSQTLVSKVFFLGSYVKARKLRSHPENSIVQHMKKINRPSGFSPVPWPLCTELNLPEGIQLHWVTGGGVKMSCLLENDTVTREIFCETKSWCKHLPLCHLPMLFHAKVQEITLSLGKQLSIKCYLFSCFW